MLLTGLTFNHVLTDLRASAPGDPEPSLYSRTWIGLSISRDRFWTD